MDRSLPHESCESKGAPMELSDTFSSVILRLFFGGRMPEDAYNRLVARFTAILG
mgnify:CR=1 FL=1